LKAKGVRNILFKWPIYRNAFKETLTSKIVVWKIIKKCCSLWWEEVLSQEGIEDKSCEATQYAKYERR
jgi:hypothetical protein